ncbi:hypothetical protein, partial [Salmonella sp. SAL4449]|uniref:hypothetical protein n=1 Tax=Salmonella sp. SAL4449 TaxID=3159904 RepID=UPI00397E4C8C
MPHPTILIASPELASYCFPEGHPFGTDRYGAFMKEMERSACFGDLEVLAPRAATRAELEYFHVSSYVDRVIELSKR